MASLATIVFAALFVIGIVPILTLVERRICAFIQGRVGPNRVGPLGILQPLADGIKALFKEDIIPARADRFLYICGPLLVFIPPALGFAVIPFGNRIHSHSLQAANLGVGILFTMSVLSVAVYGLAFGGWASHNKYSLMGGLRASAQLISYELTLGFSIVTVIMFAGTVDPQEIVRKQAAQGWNILGGETWWLAPSGLLGCLLFFISALAENNRLPFDLPECEAELVSGYHTEYSSMKFAMFFIGEYIGMVLMSSLLVTFFLGGWHLPGITDPAGDTWLDGALSVAVFTAKVLAVLFVTMWIRWTLPRFRYDQLMQLGWKRLLPLALLNVMLTALIGVLRGGA